MKKTVFGLFLLFFISGAFTLSAEEFFDQSFGDLAEEIQIAQDEGKKALLIMFEMDECPFCHWMRQQVLNRPEVQKYFRANFRILTIDTAGDLELNDFDGNTTTHKEFSLKQFRVRATPVFQFIGLDGKPIKRARLTGAAKNVGEFMLLGKYVAEGHYNSTYFSKFKRLAAK